MRKTDETYKEYFPNTNRCPVDSSECLRSSVCKLWANNKDCLYIEFKNLICEVFNSEDSTFIRIKKHDGYYSQEFRHIGFYLNFSDKLDSVPVYLEVRLAFNSYRLAEKVREQFELFDWTVESVNFDGGDDTDLVCKFKIDFMSNSVEKRLFELKNLAPKIIDFESRINICLMCKKKSDTLNEYDDKAICYECERKIITENLDKYICSACNGSGFDLQQDGGLTKWCPVCKGSGAPKRN